MSTAWPHALADIEVLGLVFRFTADPGSGRDLRKQVAEVVVHARQVSTRVSLGG
jgi:hypothetical protein